MSQWFYAKDGNQNGPVSLDELRNLFASGAVKGSDLVWNPSMKDWLPASTVNDISGGTVIPAAVNPYAVPTSGWTETVSPLADLPEIEPGSDPIQPTACIKHGFNLTTKNFLVLFLGLLIMFAVSFAVMMPFSAAQAMFGRPAAPPPELMNDPIRAFQYGMRTQFTVIYFIQQAVSTVLSSFLMAGYYRICLNLVSGLKASPGQMFGQGGKVLRVTGISILLALPTWIGFGSFAVLDFSAAMVVSLVMSLAGLFLWLRFGFSVFAVVDKDLGLGAAMKYSLSITRNNALRLFGLAFLSFLIAAAGVIACGVGAFFTFPVAIMSFAVAYRWLQYGSRVAAGPSPVPQG